MVCCTLSSAGFKSADGGTGEGDATAACAAWAGDCAVPAAQDHEKTVAMRNIC
jgi:hypothetical protein